MTPNNECERMLHYFETHYPQAPLVGQRRLRYGVWSLREGRGHVGLKLSRARGKCCVVEVMDLWVAPNRRQAGIGRLIMADVCKRADELGVMLKLRILAYHRRDNGCSNGQLTAFYLSLGFEKSPTESGYFYRAPRHSR